MNSVSAYSPPSSLQRHVSVFIKLFYYIRVVLTVVINLHILKFCEQISLCIKRCVIIFSLNSLPQLFKGHTAEFFFAIKCTGNHRLQRANKADDDDLFNVFIVVRLQALFGAQCGIVRGHT